MKKRLVFVSMVVVALVAIVALVLFLAWQEERVWTNDAQIEGFGSDLSSNVTEQVVTLFVDEGEYVEGGQVIAQLRSDVILSQRAEAAAQIAQLEQEILVREAQRAKVSDDYVRALEGIEAMVISEQTYDHKEKDLEIADAELDLAYASLELARKQLEVVEAKLTHYTILAPQSGTVAKRWVWVGDTVVPGQSLYTVYDLEDVWVVARLDETKIADVRVGDRASIRVDAYPDHTFEGEVFAINGAAASMFSPFPSNNATGNYTKVAQRVPIKLTIAPPEDFPDDQPLYLFPGMNAEVTFHG